MAGTLWLVGTPIGNLEDISDRARRVLRSVDLVAAEDMRRTGRLLQAMGIRARLVSFFEGNEGARTEELVARLRGGEDVALVSDAGMPAVSDPGFRLVRACLDQGVPVDVVPGPSAVLGALVVSGLPAARFAFEGFLPRSGAARRGRLEGLRHERRTVVVFESPRRVLGTLSEIRAVAGGERPVAVVRELTKLHQEILRGSLTEVIGALQGRELRGEVVLVLGGAIPEAPGEYAERAAVEMARALEQEGVRKREAARRAAAATGVPSGRIYRALTTGGPGPGTPGPTMAGP